MPQSHNNLAVIAAAGSRKTQLIVDCVLADPSKRVLVTTYTNENLTQITRRISAGTGMLPAHVRVMGWFSFLVNECARPYQSAVLGQVGLIRSLDFVGKHGQFVKKEDVERYYLDRHRDMYRDEVSAFAFEANRLSGGKVVERLSAMFDHIYIDEVQDMAGYDLDLLDLFMQSSIGVTMVGDPRQATYSTNNSRKNKGSKGTAVANWFGKRSKYCTIEERAVSYRCNQAICDFADGLYPELTPTTSMNDELTGHDGIFSITPDEVMSYVEKYNPTVLRYNKNSDTLGLAAMNYGVSKGSTFDRVLIFPTKPMTAYFKTRDPEKAGDRSKLYVAVTRAKYSTTFVIP